MSLLKSLPCILLALLIPGTAFSQSNMIPGTDVALGLLDGLSDLGRVGAFPNGRNGFAMSTTSCNFGSVQVPWEAAMDPDHPCIAFMMVRESDGRMEQISDHSYVKHGFFALSSNQCNLGCAGTGGNALGIGCSDTYGVGINGSRSWLGPAEEIDPWLGIWNPVCSYFDGPNCDGVFSFSTTGLDAADHRVEVNDADLNVPGANFFYQAYYMVEAEPEANRTNNLGWRPFTPTWSGSTWNVSIGGSSTPTYDSVLAAWTGASLFSSTNGGDDGRLYVGSRATPSGSDTHYEYAVHNRDNSRAVDSIRIPIAPGTLISNFGFHDIDTNAANDWTAQVVGNEVIFSTTDNPLMWNSIFNFWFDADVTPVTNSVNLAQHFPGPGAPFVAVTAVIPGGGAILPCAQADDPLEENDTCATATVIADGSQLGLYVEKTDEDWYSIALEAGGTLTVDATFAHSDGDVELELFDSCGGTLVASSTTSTDNEQVSIMNSSTSIVNYKLRTYIAAADVNDCNNLNLTVQITGVVPPDPCTGPPDVFEPNDSCAAASLLVPSTYSGLAVSKTNQDWYRIQVGPGQTLGIRMNFIDNNGDLDLSLLSSCGGTLLSSSGSVSDTEFVTATNSSGSTVTWVCNPYVWSGSLSDCNDYSLIVTLSGGVPPNLQASCFGDGSGNQCPCNNNSTSGHLGGCSNSNGDGAILAAQGNPSVTTDTLRFDLSSAAANSFGVLTSGDNRLPQAGNIGDGIQSFDGLRCIGGNFKRHGGRAISASGNSVAPWGPPGGPPAGIIAQGIFSFGQTRHFAVIYRDDDAQVCTTGLNFSNAVTVTVTP